MHTAPALACPRCQGPVDVASRHIAVAGTAVRVYCSEPCLRGITELAAPALLAAPPRRARWWIAAGLVLGGSGAVAYTLEQDPPRTVALSSLLPAPAPPPAPAALPPPAPAEAPPAAKDDELLHELMQDAWIHPLAGPHRRMPINHTAAFGAERQGQPPPECVSGHCGVDVGGSPWGEPVHAVHDGVVYWVNRGPNEEHGGIFVKISHRDGALFSWYFHLAAVPRWVQPGVRITVGQVIGLVGDTGIKRSAPHLHFAMTVKTASSRERYLDPEPLIAIWPLWIPDESAGHLSTAAPPGTPVRKPARPRPAPSAPRITDAVRDDNQPTARAGKSVESIETSSAPTATTH